MSANKLAQLLTADFAKLANSVDRFPEVQLSNFTDVACPEEFSDFAFYMGLARSIKNDPSKKIDLNKLVKLFELKQSNYGPDNIGKAGLVGLVIRLSDKFERVQNIQRNNPEELCDSLQDSYDDIFNYLIIAAMVCQGLWPKTEKSRNFFLAVEETMRRRYL